MVPNNELNTTLVPINYYNYFRISLDYVYGENTLEQNPGIKISACYNEDTITNTETVCHNVTVQLWTGTLKDAHEDGCDIPPK